MKELISAVMPFYNNEKYIKEAIESVLNQTYSNFELILVDDGSEDLSRDIVEEFMKNDSRIKLITHNKNYGAAKALKTCLLNCEGKYIIFTAADDISYPNRFEKIYNTFAQDSSLGVVTSFAEIINGKSEKNGVVYKIPEYVINNFAIENLKRNYCLGATLAVYNDSSIFSQEKLLVHSDDYELSLFYILKGYKIAVLEESLLAYRIHSSNLSNDKKKQYINTQNGLKQFNTEELYKSLLLNDYKGDSVSLALGIFNLFRNNLLEAKQIFKRIDINNLLISEQFELYFYQSVICIEEKFLEKALDFLIMAKNLSNNIVIENNIIILQLILNKVSKKETVKKMNEILKVAPQYLDAKNNLEILLIESKHFDKLKVTKRILMDNFEYRGEEYKV